MNFHYRHKWKRQDIIRLLERLELYVGAGLSIDQAFVVAEQGLSKRQAKTIAHIRNNIESGSNVAGVLVKTIGISETIGGLIAQGELGAGLGKAFGSAKELLEREDELIKKCISAMIYPMVIGIFSCVLAIGLVRGIMPQMIPMFASLHVPLPLMTRIVIAFSEILTRYGLTISFSIGLALIVFIILYRKNTKSRSFCHRIIGTIPIIGKLFRHYAISVFLRSSGTLIDSGTDVVEAYICSVRTISFLPLNVMLTKEIPNLKRGLPLGSILVGKRIPLYISALLSAGESSGVLGNSLLRAANILDREIEESLKRLTALIEPAMMIFMGGAVGIIALSIMMPIYDLSRVLQK